MTTIYLTDEEADRVLRQLLSTADEVKDLLKTALTTPNAVTEMPLVDYSALVINGGKTRLCEPIFTKDQEAILNDAFKDCFKFSITK